MAANNDTPHSGENVSEEQPNEQLGARYERIGSVGGETAIDIASGFEESSLTVHSQWFDGEPGHVEMSVSTLRGKMEIALEPEEAAALASKLSSAAAYAEGGEADE
jgi:hypothetical protein